MSVPLDRLYNFLYKIASLDHALIYRFFPHGSRKIGDLRLLEEYDLIGKRVVDAKMIFFHDQEPLNFDLYTSPNLLDDVIANNEHVREMLNPELREKCQLLMNKISSRVNLRIAATADRTWLKPSLLVHSEQRSVEADHYRAENFVGVYWWCHALIARDWFRYAEHDLSLTNKTPYTKDFLIYNRAWTGTREYRLRFTELLVQYNLVDYCQTWFSPVDENTSYQEHQFKNANLQINNYNLEKHFSPTSADSTASADYNEPDYQQTNIEVVLETLFDDSRLHLTEKTLRPIACAQPFILAATVGSLEYLRGYGFETFAPWIDETYDTIENPVQRLDAIVQEMKRIANLSNKVELYQEIRKIAARNQKLFFSEAWQQSIINEFKTNLDLALVEYNQLIKYPV